MKIGSRHRALRLFLALIILTLPVQSAYGHAEMVNAKPSPDSVLSELPKSVEVVFAEKLLVLADKQTGSISVMSELGDRIDDGQSVVRDKTLSVGLIESDVTGTISVSWRAVAQDGHPVNGEFSFAITPKATASPLEAPPPSIVTSSKSISEKKTSFYVISLMGSIVILGIAVIISLRRRSKSE